MKFFLNKSLFLLIIIISTIHFSFGQTLKNVKLDLNTGGVIYDVAYDDYLDAYIVVGDFTEIKGVSVTNIAFINANDFSIINPSIQSHISVDGPIRTVEVHKIESKIVSGFPNIFVLPGIYSIFIGGDFNTVEGQQRIKVARLSFSFLNYPGTGLKYTLSPWNAEISDGDSNDPNYYQVNDISINGDTLVVVGDFVVYEPSYKPLLTRENIISFDLSSHSFSTEYLDLFTSGNLYELDPLILAADFYSSICSTVKYKDGFYYCGTVYDNYGVHGRYFKYDPTSGNIDFFDVPPDDNMGVYDNCLSFYEGVDPQIYMLVRSQPSNPITRRYNVNGDLISSPLITNVSMGKLGFIESYKNHLYEVPYHQFSSSSQIRAFDRTVNSLSLKNSIPFSHSGQNGEFFDWLPNSTSRKWQPKKLIVANNKLFFSGNYLTQVDGLSRKGLAVFCLEPLDAKPFTQADSSICSGNTNTYSIPWVKNTDGYKWTYTGEGAQIKVGQSSYQPLPNGIPVYFSELGAWKVKIHFGPGTTAGQLTVEPFAKCNDSTDYQVSKGQTINLSLAPLPNLSMIANTMSFTCINSDSLDLKMTTSANNCTFNWTKGSNTNPLSTNASFRIYNNNLGTNSSVNSATTFYGTVTEPINGCANTGSIYVKFDTLVPFSDITPYLSTNPSVFDCATTQMEYSANIPGATVEWGLTDSTVFANNSFTIYSNDTNEVYAHATYTSNGCKSVQDYHYDINDYELTDEIVDYPGYTNGGILDTISCKQDTLNLELDFQSDSHTTINDSVSWLYNGNYIGNTLTLSSSDSVNAISNSKTYQYETYSDYSKCRVIRNVIVSFDFEPPFVSSYSNPPTLNCSTDSLELVHGYSSSNVTSGWLDNMNMNSFNDTLNIHNPGLYLYEVISNQNGCSNRDTVQIVQSNDLLLNTTNDTTVCIGDVINISASSINYSNPVNYTWSNGDNNQVTSATGGVDNMLYVTATSTDGCIGIDTVLVNTNDPITASFATFSGCLDGSASIVVDTVYGGAGSYRYALDGQNFLMNGTFTNLNFGNYSVTVQDGMGCLDAFNVLVDNSAQAPNLNFLVPTYNEAGSKVVAVNISDFNGFDSLYWDVPGNTQVFDVSDSMLVFSIDDEDWYDIGLVAYQDTCSFRFSKSIYFGPYKPSFDAGTDTLGIIDMVVYPNPTNGQFTVEVTFGVTQDYSIIITNPNGQVIPQMSVTGNDDEVVESFTFPIGTATGSYNINVISEYDAKNKIIIFH